MQCQRIVESIRTDLSLLGGRDAVVASRTLKTVLGIPSVGFCGLIGPDWTENSVDKGGLASEIAVKARRTEGIRSGASLL